MPALTLPAGDATHRLPDNFREAKCPNCGRSDLMSIREWCERSGFGTVTGWRIMKAGKGPKVTELSARCVGIREEHYLEWLNTRKTHRRPRPHPSKTK
jgi:predicted DNA-binding transcriptional regulator AlpA